MNFCSRFLLVPALLLVFLVPTNAQAPVFDWATTCASGNGYFGFSGWGPRVLAVDAQGNTYVAGAFNGAVALGNTLLNATQTYPGRNFPSDDFIAKLDPAGNYLWAVQLGDNQDARIGSLAVDGAGNVYVTGYFGSYSLAFGVSGPTLYNSSAESEGFVAKLNGVTRRWEWARRVGGTGDDALGATVISAAGDLYLLGRGDSPAIDVGPFILVGPQNFLAKLNNVGTWQWARPFGSTTTNVTQLLIIPQGGIYVAGTFTSPSTSFGPITLTTRPVPGTRFYNSNDVFVAKTDDAGTWYWAVQGDAITHQNVISRNLREAELAYDGAGHLYLAGSYEGAAVRFGATVLPNQSVQAPQPNPLPPVPYTNNYYSDAYVAQLDAATGAWGWAVRSGGPNNEKAFGVAADGQGRVYAMGDFASAVLGAENWQLLQLQAANGAVQALTNLGTLGVRQMALDGQSRLQLAGYFETAAASLPPLTLAQAGLGRQTGYVARRAAAPLAAIQGQAASAGLNVWPNPTQNRQVQVQGAAPGQAVQVLDALGRLVSQARMPAAGPLLLVLPASLPAGLYLVRGDGQARRLIVE